MTFATPDVPVVSKKRKAGYVLVAVIATLAVLYGLLHTALFRVTVIEVRGTQQLRVDEITRIARVHVGEPLAFVHIPRAKKLLGSDPRIAHVAVHRSWPHTLVLSVKERVPVALVQTADKKWARVGADGVVVDMVSNINASPIGVPRLPVVVNASTKSNPGQMLDTDVGALLRIAAALPDSLRPKVTQLQYQDGVYRLGLNTNVTVVLGNDTAMGDKLMAAAAIVSQTDMTNVSVLDVQSPKLPVATPRNGSQANALPGSAFPASPTTTIAPPPTTSTTIKKPSTKPSTSSSTTTSTTR